MKSLIKIYSTIFKRVVKKLLATLIIINKVNI